MSNLLTERWLRLAFSGDSTTVQLDEAKKKNKNSKVYDDCWDGYRKVPGKERGEEGSCELDDHDEKMGEVEEIQEISRKVKRVIQEKKKDQPGLWHHINKNKASGKKPNHPNSKAYKKAVKAARKINNESDETLEESDESAFMGALAAAKKDGKDEVEIDGKKFPVTMDDETADEIVGEAAIRSLIRNIIMEAVYNGRKVELNKPMSNPENKKKKSKVYVSTGKKLKSGKHKGQMKAKKVQFGQAGVKIKKNNPKKRSNFRKRHKCHEKKPKDSAGYWSCKAW